MQSISGWASLSVPNSTFNDFVSAAGILTAALASLLVNGQSNQGFSPSPGLPSFLGSSINGAPWTNATNNEAPWGNRTVGGTNPNDVPDTGVTRYYDFTIARGIIAPDGVNKNSILVNNQYPGPLIEADWGDYIQVTVHNQIVDPEEGTTLHWHGLTQKGTPWYDGTPSISQCPIAPGTSFTYTFQASLYGTSWYHSHLSAQYTDGLYGPMVIYGPTNTDYDFDLGPILIHDYFHTEYTKIIENVVGNNPLTALLAPSDNTLIHGLNNYVCSLGTEDTKCTSGAALAKFNFTAGKTHRLRLINPSSAGSPILFSIDNHNLTIIANDFVPVVPYMTNVVTIAAGQRTDVTVKANGNPGDTAWMRIRQPDLCNFVLQPFGLAAIYYNGADTDSIPWTLPNPDFNTPRLENCNNDPLEITVPSYQITPNPNPDTTVVITMSLTLNATNHTLYQMNGQAFRGDFNDPLLRPPYQGNGSYSLDPERNVYDFGNNESIRLIFVNNIPFNHPMHLHGQQMFVLAVGTGTWDGTIVNPANPQRRDTQIVPANGYMVVQLTADNPGVWPFHCHIAWHLSAGMLINVILKPQELKQQDISKILAQSCDAWNSFSAANVVDDIDSGLR